jgi:two-component system response regulator GlrR
VQQGGFREDLYYRLNVVPILLPPLRERKGDIPLLANHFLTRFAKHFGRPVTTLSAEVLELMAAEPWPGNVRELMNRIQRMVVMADDSIVGLETWRRSALETGASPASGTSSERSFMQEKRRVVARFEANYISECLRLCRGNVAQAARAARMDRKNFWSLMKRHHIDPTVFKQPTAVGEATQRG